MARGVSRYEEAAQQQRLWTPKDSGVLVAGWFDSSNLSTVSCSASGVSEWRNASGNNVNATQATTSSQPAFQDRGINNLSAISWSGSKFFNTSLSASSASETIFAVCKADSGGTRTVLGSNDQGGRQFRVNNNGELVFLRQNQASLASSGVGNTIFFDANIFIGMTYNSTETRFYSDGRQLGSATTVNPALTAGRTTDIGVNTYLLLEFWSGLMGEILVFQSVLSLHERQKVEGYLAWKWGIQSRLASEHPFLLFAPTIGG